MTKSFLEFIIILVWFIIILIVSGPANAQDYPSSLASTPSNPPHTKLIEYETTTSHFATIVVENYLGTSPESTIRIDTSEGEVLIIYQTLVTGDCTLPPNQPDCPDRFQVVPPDGIAAVPIDTFIDEDTIVRVKLFRYTGV